ncbi:MBL fold metallo-hydrolase [Roseovarius sp. S4756]|uniref:MBL fold metallo-hydrolase n=1 Tax=Roseovarius maritimus TaxID=3342637 RepID=UPI0037261F96
MSDTFPFDPMPGQPEHLPAAILGQDLRRILAPNPSPMTFRGTNTYLLGTKDIAVIDPGPDDDRHLSALLSAIGPDQHVSHILVTHAHRDHSPLARRLAAETGAPVLAFGDASAGRSPVMAQLAADGMIGGGEGVDAEFAPNIFLKDGEVLHGAGWQIHALWTPGHFGNHMCFAAGNAIFTGDLVMGWASSLVSPPDGDAAHFVASCARLKEVGAAVLHPGHGAPVLDPSARLDWLMQHRAAREASIIAALADGPATAAALTGRIYTQTPAALMPAATRNVLAHLVDLTARGEAAAQGPLHADAVFTLTRGSERS